MYVLKIINKLFYFYADITTERMASEADKKQPIFKELNADEEPEVTEIESLCLQCHKNVRYVFFLL